MVKVKNNLGVHKSHCCVLHGCKYGDEHCPVVHGYVEQDYLCESCDMDGLENMEDLRIVLDSDRTTNFIINSFNGIIERYTSLVECGDCGNWNPYDEKEVKNAIKAVKLLNNKENFF